MVLSAGCPGVCPFTEPTSTAAIPTKRTKIASTRKNAYLSRLRMFPPATSAPSLTHSPSEYHSRRRVCFSSIILSPLNGNVKMSPHETGDIHVESEGTAASERDQRVHQGRHGVCQSRRTPVSERATD